MERTAEAGAAPSRNQPVGVSLGLKSTKGARWWRYRKPFAHVRAEEVFDLETYERLVDSFREVERRTRAGETRLVFGPPAKHYDARICGLGGREAAKMFSPLLDVEWLEYLAGITGRGDPRVVDAALHHIPRASRSGYIHTDFCSAWFDGSSRGAAVRFPSRERVDYFSGTLRHSDAEPEEFLRAVTMIFYLANDGWTKGDGGETALFATASGRGEKSLCEPRNNSLLLFECTPHSFHALQGNPGRDRNSVILWLHAGVKETEKRWPEGMHRRRPA